MSDQALMKDPTKDLLPGQPKNPSLLEPPQKTFSPVDVRDLYWIWYRKGQNPFPLVRVFHYKGGSTDSQRNLLKAIDRGRDFCERITGRFLRVEPFISDLDASAERYQETEQN